MMNHVWDFLKDKGINPILRHFLHKNLGQYFLGKIKKEQLLISATDTAIENVQLNCETVNEKLNDGFGFGIQIVEGHVGTLKFKTPWKQLVTGGESSEVEIEVTNLTATFRPVTVKTDINTSMMQSISSSMINPIQFAQDYLENSAETTYISSAEKIKAMEFVAQNFESVMEKVKICFINTEIRIEYLPNDSNQGIVLVLKIDRIKYENESNNSNMKPSPTNLPETEEMDEDKFCEHGKHFISTYTIKHITLEGITLLTEEFRISKTGSSTENSLYSSTISQIPASDIGLTLSTDEFGGTGNQCEDNAIDIFYSKGIVIGQMEGKQDLRIKYKQLDDVPGANVYLELQFGALNCFLSPRQFHLVTKFCDFYINDSRSLSKTSDDFKYEDTKNVFEKCQGNMVAGGFASGGGWADPMEEATKLSNVFSSSVLEGSNICKYSISPTTSMTSSCTSCKQQRSSGNSNNVNEISYINVDIASVTAILLQEDVLFEDSRYNSAPITEESVNTLENLSNQFFDQNVKSEAIYLSEKNYLKFLLNPVFIEGEEQRFQDHTILVLKTSVTSMDFAEIVQNVSTPIIDFQREKTCITSPCTPEFSCSLKKKVSVGSKISPSKTDISFYLHECAVELDISLFDRLSAIINYSPFTPPTNVKKSQLSQRNETITDLTLDTPCLNARLRFPIADMRPIHDPDRIPWWKKNIRPDFGLIVFDKFRLKYSSTNIDISANQIDLFHCENSSKTHLLKSVMKANGMNIDYPRISIGFPSESSLRTSLKCTTADSDSGETSGESSKLFQRNFEAPPFSAKQVHRSSDAAHDSEEETILLPGETAEIKSFRERSIKLSKLQLKIHVPQISVQLKSKHIYEIIYNRINTDLLMWEPSAPEFRKKSGLENVRLGESFKKASKFENDDESSSFDDEFSSDNESFYRSAHSRKRNKKSQLLDLCGCSFELSVTEGILVMYPPHRDSAKNVIPEQCGEFIFKLENLNLFSVNCYNGDENHAFICLEATGEMYHCGLVPSVVSNPLLRAIDDPLPQYQNATLYPTVEKHTLGDLKANPKRSQLTLIVEIRRVPEHRVKRLRLTAGIQATTLKYIITSASYSWLNQLIDMFNVVDFPIEGYQPYSIVTEMQLHLWNCSIDYRPKYFFYRALAELGMVMISSNIITSSTGCTLRFVFEDGCLAIAPYNYVKHENDPTNCITTLPLHELVSIVDYTLLDFSVRINDTATDLFPKFDFRASNPDMHLRTCTDSARALSDLLLYIAEYGDLRDFKEDNILETSQELDSSESLLSMNENKNFPEITKEQQERISQLITEAIRDQLKLTSESSSEDEANSGCTTEISYVFPDELNNPKDKLKKQKLTSSTTSQMIKKENKLKFSQRFDKMSSSTKKYNNPEVAFKCRESENELHDILDFETSVMKKSYHRGLPEDCTGEPHPHVREDLGGFDKNSHSPKTSIRRKKKMFKKCTPEEDFHMFAEEEREYMVKCGRDIKLSDDPLRIVDNHFSLPEQKPDLLRAPEGFPMAVSRYVLCDMGFTWHLYDGHDFHHKPGDTCENCEKKKKLNDEMSDAYKHAVSYSKDQHRVKFSKGNKNDSVLTYKLKGGSGRNHSVLVEIQVSKAKVSHEIYPSTTMQASRQVFVINEIEIRDRLECSDINKFLYHNHNKLLNKNIHPQLVIKALHVRPDPRLGAQECSLKISSKSLKLNIDQDCLLFLAKFFNELSNGTDVDDNVSRKSQDIHPPIMMVEDVSTAMEELKAKHMVSNNLDLLLDEDEIQLSQPDCSQEQESILYDVGSDDIYFKDVFFGPDVTVMIDYVGKSRLDKSHGAIVGFLMGLGQLQCSEIRLKKINKHGIKGIDQILKILLTEWLRDIKKNQLGDILKGIGAINTIIQIVQGFVDLFWLPYQQYRRDGRIIRGLQLGAQSFAARTTLAALEITTRVMQLLQITAETAYDMLSPGPSVRQLRYNRKNKRKRLARPKDLREGVVTAYHIVKEGFSETACNLIETTAIERDQKGVTGAVGAIFRQIPPLVVSPVVYATQATTNVLGGVKSQLVTDAKIEAKEKWKDDNL